MTQLVHFSNVSVRVMSLHTENAFVPAKNLIRTVRVADRACL